jgi:hypothetical protein
MRPYNVTLLCACAAVANMPVITAAKKYLFIVVAKIGDLIPFFHENAESQSPEIISIEIKDTHHIRRDRMHKGR